MEKADGRRDKESKLMKEAIASNVVIVLKKEELELLKDIVIGSISNKNTPAKENIKLAAKLIEACEENK